VFLGRPLGISYEVSAHIGPLSVQATAIQEKKSRVALRFRKASYFPLLKEVKPTETGEKIFLGGSKPLALTATLDREIYYPGQPILVTYATFLSLSCNFVCAPFLTFFLFFFFFLILFYFFSFNF